MIASARKPWHVTTKKNRKHRTLNITWMRSILKEIENVGINNNDKKMKTIITKIIIIIIKIIILRPSIYVCIL